MKEIVTRLQLMCHLSKMACGQNWGGGGSPSVRLMFINLIVCSWLQTRLYFLEVPYESALLWGYRNLCHVSLLWLGCLPVAKEILYSLLRRAEKKTKMVLPTHRTNSGIKSPISNLCGDWTGGKCLSWLIHLVPQYLRRVVHKLKHILVFDNWVRAIPHWPTRPKVGSESENSLYGGGRQDIELLSS